MKVAFLLAAFAFFLEPAAAVGGSVRKCLKALCSGQACLCEGQWQMDLDSWRFSLDGITNEEAESEAEEGGNREGDGDSTPFPLPVSLAILSPREARLHKDLLRLEFELASGTSSSSSSSSADSLTYSITPTQHSFCENDVSVVASSALFAHSPFKMLSRKTLARKNIKAYLFDQIEYWLCQEAEGRLTIASPFAQATFSRLSASVSADD